MFDSFNPADFQCCLYPVGAFVSAKNSVALPVKWHSWSWNTYSSLVSSIFCPNGVRKPFSSFSNVTSCYPPFRSCQNTMLLNLSYLKIIRVLWWLDISNSVNPILTPRMILLVVFSSMTSLRFSFPSLTLCRASGGSMNLGYQLSQW